MSWQRIAEQLLRHVAPDADGLPLYLVDAFEVREHDPRLCGDHCLAWTSPAADLLLFEYLRSVRQWKGRGFATVVHVSEIATMPNILGVVLHEFGHAIDAGLPPSRAIAAEDQIYTQPQTLALAEYFRNEAKSQQLPRWHNHGERFVRTACHLAYRAGRVLESIRPGHLSFASNYHPLPFNEACWMTALAPELQSRSTEPIQEILDSDPPQAFTDRWAAATGR